MRARERRRRDTALWACAEETSAAEEPNELVGFMDWWIQTAFPADDHSEPPASLAEFMASMSLQPDAGPPDA